MEAAPTGEKAKKHRADRRDQDGALRGPEWTPVERAVEAGTLAGIPVMVDFGSESSGAPLAELVTKKLRPGDIYTHCLLGPAAVSRIRRGT